MLDYGKSYRNIVLFIILVLFQTGYYTGLDHLAQDLNLVFENAKRYNADESIIYRVSRNCIAGLTLNSGEIRRYCCYLIVSCMIVLSVAFHLNLCCKFTLEKDLVKVIKNLLI